MPLLRDPTPAKHTRALLALLLFIAAFLTTARAIDHAATPEIDVLPNKLAEFTRVPNRFNTAILGSSHVYHQIDPALFDATTASRGLSTRSFNLGIPGWVTLPLSYLLREVLASNQNLQYVVIDAEYVQFEINPRNIRVQQTITWHDLPTSLLYARTLLASDTPWRKSLDYTRLHSLPFIYNLASFGRLQTPLTNWLERRSPDDIAQLRAGSSGPNQDGFRNYTQMLESSDPKSRATLLALQKELTSPEGRAKHAREVASIRSQKITGEPRPESAIAFAELQRLCDDAGVQAVFITGPVFFTVYADTKRAHDAGIIRNLLYFTDPNKYPELYAFENQFDNRHLNAKGAEIYTRLIAEGFAQTVNPPVKPAP